MRGLLMPIAGLAAIVSTASPGSAQNFLAAVGQRVEMYFDNACSGSSCGLSFPLNSTGKRIWIDNVSCRILVTDSGTLLYTSIAATASNVNPSPIKETYFETRIFLPNSGYGIHYLSAKPGIVLGVNRYLTIFGQATAGQVQMKCAASGIFAE